MPEKFFVQLLPTKFLSPTKIIKTFFWCDLQKQSSCVFLQTLGAIFGSQATLGGIFTQIFSKLNVLEMCLHPLHPHLQHNCFS